MKINNILIIAHEKLKEANLDQNIAEILMMAVIEGNYSDVFLSFEDNLVDDDLVYFNTMLDEVIIKGRPVQYVIGYEYFLGYKFMVNEAVLIPRPETEELVYEAISFVEQSTLKNLTAVDIGTGSGAIALSLKLECPQLSVTATDISETAISVANNNAVDLKSDVNFLIGDYCQPLIDKQLKFDLLIANPPYISVTEKVADVVSQHEPHVALFGEDNGYGGYLAIFKSAKLILNNEYCCLFEIGNTQKDTLIKIATEYFPDADISVIKDINKQDRILKISNYHQQN